MIPLKKSEFINIIAKLKNFNSPKLKWEQYVTDPIATADLFFHIAFEQQDLANNLVIDLGCGPGNLSIAGAILGANHIIAIDIDKDILQIALENRESLSLTDSITFLQYDITKPNFIRYLNKKLQTLNLKYQKIVVVSNPPFGVHNRGIDHEFIQKALKIGNIIYSIHLASPKSRDYLQTKIRKRGGIITEMLQLNLILKATYRHHRKHQKKVQTDIYRIISHQNF